MTSTISSVKIGFQPKSDHIASTKNYRNIKKKVIENRFSSKKKKILCTNEKPVYVIEGGN